MEFISLIKYFLTTLLEKDKTEKKFSKIISWYALSHNTAII